MNKLQRIPSLLIVLCLAMSMIISAGAIAPVSEEVSSPAEQNAFFLELARTPSLLESIPTEIDAAATEKIELNSALKQSGYLTVEDGHYIISEEANSLTSDTVLLEDLLSDYKFANSAIDDGILAIDPVTLELYSCEPTEEALQLMKENDRRDPLENGLAPLVNHGCGYDYLYLGVLARNNRSTIQVYYNEMIALEMTNPSVSPGASTTLFWVGKVQENGAWDYKSQPGFSPYNHMFCCTYGVRDSDVNVHRTSEFIGNYNYSFTGRTLFSLNVLKLGSDAIGGNIFVPDVADYPAIEEGYDDAGY